MVESLIDVVYNGKITENEDGTYAVLEDPVQSTSRIISADRMEAKSPMQQDEDEEDPIPSSSMPTEGAGGPAEALEGSTKGRRAMMTNLFLRLNLPASVTLNPKRRKT